VAKELIFMGKQAGKVRLALFEDSHGTTRKLPVKEISEEVFVAGIKAGNLPVRGFGVNRGRITCKYGDWYRLPDIGPEGAMSLFGLVYFGQVALEADGAEEDEVAIPSEVYGAKLAKYYGIASVDWDTGTFRVLAPSTYFHLSKSTQVHVYTYDGPYTPSKLSPRAKDLYGKDVDYTFSECDSVESCAEIAAWSKIHEKSFAVLLQWVFQRCEMLGYRDTSHTVLTTYLTSNTLYGSPDIVLLGNKPIDYLELPDNVGYLATCTGRQVGTIRTLGKYSLTLQGMTDIIVDCEHLQDLSFSTGTRAKIIRTDVSPLMTIHGWEGFKGHDGDFTGYRLRALSYCFREQPDVDYLLFDVEFVRGSFCDIGNVTVEFTQPILSMSQSFRNFNGTLVVDGIERIESSFEDVVLTNPLDLRQTTHLSRSVNQVKATILLPEYFSSVEGDIFQATEVRYIKMRLDCPKAANLHTRHWNLESDALRLEVFSETKVINPVVFYYGVLEELIYTSAYGSAAPKFSRTSIYPNTPVTGITYFLPTSFYRLSQTTLDLSVFPDVEVIPANCVVKCGCSTLIFGSNVKKIETKAVVDCDKLRWVYIPDSVEDLGVFNLRPRIPYTICTSQGSEADKFAQKNRIDVRYVDNVKQFQQVVNEIPEEIEGTVAVAILTGKGDGAEAAIKQACEYREACTDIEPKFTIEEKTQRSIEEVKWIGSWQSYLPEDADRWETNVSVHIAIAHISNNAEYDKNVLEVTDEDVLYKTYKYRAGEYTMVGRQLRCSRDSDYGLWVVVKENTVINAFTEVVSSINSNCGVQALLAQAMERTLKFNSPSALSTLVEHLNYTRSVVSLRGRSVSYTVSDMVYRALRTTYIPLGVYTTDKGVRVVLTVDRTDLSYVAFTISAGAAVDDGRFASRASTAWGLYLKVISGAFKVDSIEGWSRMYSILGAGATLLQSVAAGATTEKCDTYDFTLPTAEIAALKVIVRALFDETPTVSTAELQIALKDCGLAKRMTAGAWRSIENQGRHTGNDTVYNCTDGTFTVTQRYDRYVTWIKFEDASGKTTVYAVAIPDDAHYLLKDIVGLYDGMTQAIGPYEREEHYAHVNCMLPVNEFLVVRRFKSGGCYTSYGGNFSPVLLVSRISGKVVIGAQTGGDVVPVFITNSFRDALRIFEICGLLAFNPETEWLYKKHESLCSGLFRTRLEFESGVPDFGGFTWTLRHIRNYLRRGECDGYGCVNGTQEIFDLAVKHPPTSDYIVQEV